MEAAQLFPFDDEIFSLIVLGIYSSTLTPPQLLVGSPNEMGYCNVHDSLVSWVIRAFSWIDQYLIYSNTGKVLGRASGLARDWSPSLSYI